MHLRTFSRTLTLATGLLIASAASAQSFTADLVQQGLTPASMDKLKTLQTFSTLPAGEWRVHPGDIPHGESLTLDDSAWPQAILKRDGPQDTVWYRRTIEIPRTLNGYDISGARISFQFRAVANGPVPEIIYFNGRRVALGDDLEPIILFDPAHAGDKVLVAVKLLRTAEPKRSIAVAMHIDANPARPDPDAIRIQALTAATLLPALPNPRPDLLATVQQAVAAIDTAALTPTTQAAFDKSLVAAQQILLTLAPIVAQVKVDLVGNSHIDAAWLWPRSETIDVAHRTFATALQLMNEYPNYTFTQSAAQYSAWMADKYPAMNEQIKQRIKEGRWEIVGGMWVEPDLNMPGGESLVRQLLVGQRFFSKEYGVTARIGWNPDSFGYNWQLPQIYKRSGLDYFVTQKMHWNDTNVLPFQLFWWQSPDGSKVLTSFPSDYVHENVNPVRIAADFAGSTSRTPGLHEVAPHNPGESEYMDLYGVGDHGGGPTRSVLDEADHWIAAGKDGTAAVPSMLYSTAQNYFTHVEQHLNRDSPVWNYDTIPHFIQPLPGHDGEVGLITWKDELYFEYHRGVMTTQAAHKNNMRRSESDTLDTEKIASFAWLAGDPYPADILTENWKKITFNQFHDLAAGSGIAVIYRDAQKDYTEVFNADSAIISSSLRTIEATIDTRVKAGVPVLVYNSMAWPRSETAELHFQLPTATDNLEILDANEQPLRFQLLSHDARTNTFTVIAHVDDVPAMGYKTLHAVAAAHPAPPPADVNESALYLLLKSDADNIYLGNRRLSLIIDKKTGCITRLADRSGSNNFIAPGACANQLQTFKDTPKQYDAWNIDPGTLDAPMTPISNVDSITTLVDGPIRKTIRIQRTWQSSHFTQDVTLDAGADTVVVSNDIDWHETHVLLKAAFPLAHSGPKATFEIPFGSIQRPTTRDNSWQKAQFEVPAQQWADLGDATQGVSILNDSKYGYDALGNTLRLTLLRSPTWPDPDADRGHQHFTYAIYPHFGPWQTAATVRRGYELNTPLPTDQVFAHTGALPSTHSWASVENSNVILTAIKKAEDANALIFRMYEFAGKQSDIKLHIPPGATYAIETNLMEAPTGPHIATTGDTITIPIKPFEILTVQAVYPK